MSEQFGKRIRNEFIYTSDPNYIPINNGGSGTLPKSVFDRKVQYLKYINDCPENWILVDYHQKLKEQVQEVAQFIGGSKDQIALVDSATASFASIF